MSRSSYGCHSLVTTTMLLALLVAACAAPASLEWVEISQTHYKKPAPFPTTTGDRIFYPAQDTTEHTRNNFYSTHTEIITEDGLYKPLTRPLEDEDYFEHFPDKVTYPNRSITEHKWRQDAYKPDNTKRFNNAAKITGNITPEFSVDVFGEVTEQMPQFVTVTRNKIRHQETVPATIERVPTKGSVKRVQLTNTPVKSPALPKVLPATRDKVKHHETTSIDSDASDEFEIKADIFKDTQSNDATSNVRRVFTSTRDTPFRKYQHTTPAWLDTTASIIVQNNKTTAADDKPTQSTSRNKGTIIKINNYSTSTNNSVTEENITTKVVDSEPSGNSDEHDKRFQGIKDVTDTKIHKIDKINDELPTIPDSKNDWNLNRYENKDNKPNLPKLNIDTIEKSDEKITNEEIKVNTMENLMKFLKVITETISRNSRRGVNGKVKYLHELKDTLLSSIKERIDSTWPDEPTARGRRSARSAEARGHVEFPSSESSLMTISFLTFAVFLIKLVLQVIQTYKHKTMMVAPVVVATAGRKLWKT